MERREGARIRPEEKVLHTIRDGMDDIFKEFAGKKSTHEFRTIGYNMLQVLPKQVTDLQVVPDVRVTRIDDEARRVTWNLMRVDTYATRVAADAGLDYTSRFPKKT